MKIKIQEIKDRGNDEERIVLRVLEDCNLGRYLVLDTTFDKNGNISNKIDMSMPLVICLFEKMTMLYSIPRLVMMQGK